MHGNRYTFSLNYDFLSVDIYDIKTSKRKNSVFFDICSDKIKVIITDNFYDSIENIKIPIKNNRRFKIMHCSNRFGEFVFSIKVANKEITAKIAESLIISISSETGKKRTIKAKTKF